MSTQQPDPKNGNPAAKARGGVIRASEMAGYSPANHHGTTNIRLVGPENGARHITVTLAAGDRQNGRKEYYDGSI